MRSGFLVMAVICLLIGGCASNSVAKVSEEQQRQFDNMIENENFEIVFKSAQPMNNTGMQAVANAGLLAPGSNLARIDLLTTPNYIRKIGDSLSASLPYYGERQIGGGYNNSNEVGINFDGVPEDISIVKNENTGSYKMSYTINNKSENFIVNTTLFPNNTVNTTIASSHRRIINYRGVVSVYAKSE
ncbi:DUF4251 domain-containing protein [Spongiivirga sp. MCCC 1A20706]|uniref:DUF4251 domain-containing protein n=1 Tax=Spongiivirga sp. MCCC 1A20706 TaxID=3160963 RepID=UPI0039775E7D